MRSVIEIFKSVFWRDKLALTLIVLGLVLNIVGWGILYWQIRPTQVGVILHYNIFFGIDVFLLDYWQLFQVPLGGIILWFFNWLLGVVLYGQVMQDQIKETELNYDRKIRYKSKGYFLDYFDAKRLSSYLLWSGGLLVQLIILIYIAAVVVVNK